MDKSFLYVNAPIQLVNNDKIRIRGRHTEVDGMLAFDWTNSGIAFNFEGSGFILSLGAYSADIPAYLRVIIDGKRHQRFAVVNGSEKIIIEGLADKRHRVEILKVTEGEAKLLMNTIELIGNGASLRKPPFNSPRKIEFIGDSMTCGYGVLASKDAPDYQTFQQDGTYTYAYLTVEKLGAEARYLCASGKGIVCNCDGNYDDVRAGQYCSYQSRTGGECNDGWTPEVVVMNIGTNDCGGPAPKEQFEEAARALIAKERARYENAQIIWVYGMMNRDYKDVLRKVIRDIQKTDDKVHFLYVVDPIFENDEELGANGHPNVRASIRVARMLTKKIRSLTGWKNAVEVPEDND